MGAYGSGIVALATWLAFGVFCKLVVARKKRLY